MAPRTAALSNAAKQQEIEQQLARLPAMSRQQLQQLWMQLFDRPSCPSIRRETLIPILAYRIQEKAFGGLKESTVRKLRDLAGDIQSGRKSAIKTMIRPKVGTRYIREYEGKLHEVTVLESGYVYESKVYRSLSEIAKIITGTKWSGPVFFGYKRPAKRTSA